MTRRISVLLVDDDREATAGIKYALEDRYYVRVATSAHDALDEILALRPDVLITDQRMPGISGISLCEQVGKLYPAVKRVIFTAYGTVDDCAAAMRAGASSYLAKPGTAERLIDAIEHATGRRERLSVLFVDDVPAVLRTFQRTFADRWIVITASNSSQAADVIRAAYVDVVVCDWQLGGASGLDFLAAIAREAPSVGRVLVTGTDPDDSALAAIGTGIGVVSKSSSSEAMARAVELAARARPEADGTMHTAEAAELERAARCELAGVREVLRGTREECRRS